MLGRILMDHLKIRASSGFHERCAYGAPTVVMVQLNCKTRGTAVALLAAP